MIRHTAALAVLALHGTLLAQQAKHPERVPPSDVVDGKPQGIFVGRSLLSGRAVCLLFLSGGRVTRLIPPGGLEQFDWARHLTAHPRDSGTWEMSATQLRITWGDGGVNQGTLTVHQDAIEFYGKRYARPGTAKVSDLVGRWESARGTAVGGGAGINNLAAWSVESDGRYVWTSTTGGVAAGRATASKDSRAGMLRISGQTIVFEANDGTVSTHTFLPVAGSPLQAFSVDGVMYTRMD